MVVPFSPSGLLWLGIPSGASFPRGAGIPPKLPMEYMAAHGRLWAAKDDHEAKALIAKWFFRRLWMGVNRREQALAPRAGLLEGCNFKDFGWLTSLNVQIEPKGLLPAVANRARSV
jgi:hypothetical protein